MLRKMVGVALITALAGTSISATTAASARSRHGSAAMKPRISADSAKAIASARVPGGKIESQELERERGKLIFTFDIKVPGKSGIDEVHVDAMNGKVLAVEHETPKAERAEKAKEKHAKSGKRS